MRSKVWFIPSPLDAGKVRTLIDSINPSFIKPESQIAIKLHWGEEKNDTYIPPRFILPITEYVKQKGAKPFLTDSLVLYSGRRREGISNILLAEEHGFRFQGVPIVIADGLRGFDFFEQPVGLKHFESVKLVSVLKQANAFLVVSHFKGHMVAGFGGALKNLGMGFAAIPQKQKVHAEVRPQLDQDLCNGCGDCVSRCPVEAIQIVDRKAEFDIEKCIGCATCIAFCPQGALKILWNEEPVVMIEKLIETAKGVIDNINSRVLYLNFVINFTKDCDCQAYHQDVLLEPVGLLASYDPVAIDKASLDLLARADPVKGTEYYQEFIESSKHPLDIIYPQIPFRRQIEYAQTIGCGNSDYQIIETR